jgi:regulator of Ty1 transposition protein 109
MTAHERLSPNSSITHLTLADQLAERLPKGLALKVYHVSSPPSRASALYSAPPGERPDRTYCESHFLAASISIDPNSTDNDNQANEVIVFGIEVLIYSTAYLTTIFVSKADSTGYLHLLNLPKGSPSPLKEISSAFVAYLIEARRRLGIKSVISLFARAQDQYLFPGSAENSGKHVLDDRRLVRWWCRVLDPFVDTSRSSEQSKGCWGTVHGYLIIPGLDNYESRSYLPKGSSVANSIPQWTIGHPLEALSRHRKYVPPRCLIPHFPDDPKSRFLDELDDELSSSQEKSISGEWRSIKTLDQFWEMMAFRQECSAGRLVGFIWMVLEPASFNQTRETRPAGSQCSATSITSSFHDENRSTPDLPLYSPASITSNTPFTASLKPHDLPSSSSKQSKTNSSRPQQSTLSVRTNPAKKNLTGSITARQPRIKTESRLYWLEIPEKTPYYVWPQEGRGQVVIEQKAYKRITELLLRLDFANLDLAVNSTRRWINEVQSGVASNAANGWGSPVTGTKPYDVRSQNGSSDVTTLNVGLVRKKRKGETEAATIPSIKDGASIGFQAPAVNILSAEQVRKKART